jgi:molybdopterin-binding protein
MKISARNILAGTVTDIKLGTTTAHVTLDVNGSKITASITNESVAELGLKVGSPAKAVIKASSVLIAVD